MMLVMTPTSSSRRWGELLRPTLVAAGVASDQANDGRQRKLDRPDAAGLDLAVKPSATFLRA